MSNEKFKVGDTVALNCGASGIMSITEFQDDGKVAKCIWFNNGLIRKELIPIECLIKAEPTTDEPATVKEITGMVVN